MKVTSNNDTLKKPINGTIPLDSLNKATKEAGFNNLKNVFNSVTVTSENLRKNEVKENHVLEAIQAANKSFYSKYTRFEFSVHEETKAIMVKIFDQKTDELIKEIPPEKILDMVAVMWELAGIIVDDKV